MCTSGASTGLCGGQRATAVPTATRSASELQLSLEMGSLTRIGVWGQWKYRDFPDALKASVIGEGTGYMQPMNFPGSQGTTCR